MNYAGCFLTQLVISAVLVAGSPIQADDYSGSSRCKHCHKYIYKTYIRSGHPYKLQKITGSSPSYPARTSPGVLNPPKGLDWNDISYVIGGYGWKAHFMDQEGYILTGENQQYNLPNPQLGTEGGWAAYDKKKAPRKPYTCGQCHTTGWIKTGPDGPHQENLPGIHGTWKEPGITCEACHGPSSKHVASPHAIRPSIKENCNSCHARGDVDKIDASGGLVKHHEQYEDLLASPHQSKPCTTCHDPHKSTRYGFGGYKGLTKACLNCHAADRVEVAPEAHGVCTSCHMPATAKSAVSIKVKSHDGAIPIGDVYSHIFRINTDPDWKMFTDDGKFVRIDKKGRAYLTLDRVCLPCHRDRNINWAIEHATSIHE